MLRKLNCNKKIQIEDSDLYSYAEDSDLDAEDSVVVLDSVDQDSVLVLDLEVVDLNQKFNRLNECCFVVTIK